MQKARPLVSFQLFLLSIAGAGAFSPVAKSNNVRISPSALCSERPSEGHVNMQRRSDFLALLGTVVTGSIVSSVEPAYATVPFNPCKCVGSGTRTESNYECIRGNRNSHYRIICILSHSIVHVPFGIGNQDLRFIDAIV